MSTFPALVYHHRVQAFRQKMNTTRVNEQLMAHYFSGSSTEEERSALLSWLNKSRENEEQFFLMKDIYDAGNTAQLFDEAQTDEGWRKLQLVIDEKQRLKTAANATATITANATTNATATTTTTATTNAKANIIRPTWMARLRRYAAILAIGVLSGMALMKFNSAWQSRQSMQKAGICEVTTGKGERVKVKLPDGSCVILNACSYLSYSSSDFGRKTRQLQFFGEGYFDVQTNPDMPFVVQTAGLNIKAYGTVFNVKAYMDENVVETTLVEGSVTIEDENRQKIVTLQPEQAIVIPKKTSASNANTSANAAANQDQKPPEEADNKAKAPVKKEQTVKIQEQKAILKKKIETEVVTSWKDNQWIIKSETLESLAQKIERKYDVTFTFLDKGSKAYIFTGTLKDYPLEQILEVIRLNAPIQYTVKEKNVTIREDRLLKEKYKQLIRSTH